MLADAEVECLRDWLVTHDAVNQDWPSSIIKPTLDDVLTDSRITAGERAYRIEVPRSVVGRRAETVDAATRVTELAFDGFHTLTCTGQTVCLTGDFVYGPRERCENACVGRGGIV
jgi:hypothetical protein